MDHRTHAGNEGGRSPGESRAGRAIEELGPEAQQKFEELGEELRGRVDEAVDRAAMFIRERPGTSLLIAAGVGYLFGRIVRS